MSGSMQFDPTVPLRAGQGTIPLQNPLDTFGKFQGIQNALTQNRAMEAGIKQTETGTAGMEQEQQFARVGKLGAITGGLLSAHPNGVPYDAAVNAVALGLRQGLYGQKEAGELVKSLPSGDTPEDTATRTAAINQFHFQALAIGEQANRVRGQMVTVSDGQQNIPALQSETKRVELPGAVQVYPSRDALNQGVVIGYDPLTKAPIMGPKAIVTPPNLGGPAVNPNPALGTGRFPAALRNPDNAPPPVTGIVAGAPGPAQMAALATGGTASAGAFQSIVDQGLAAKGQDAVLATMQNEAQQFITGTGQDKIKNFQAAMLRFTGPIAKAFGIDEKTIAANESFDKLVAQIQTAQGATSDARLNVLQHANPTSLNTPAGLDLIMRQLRGSTDYLQARQKLAAAYPDKTDREGFEAKIATNLDPRAFQYARLTPEQRATYRANIKDPKDQRALIAAYNWAEKNGLIGGGGAR